MGALLDRLKIGSSWSLSSTVSWFDLGPSNDRESTLNIQFSDGVIVGNLNVQSSKVLKPLFDSGIRLEAFASTKAMVDTISRAKKVTEAALKVNINLYGPESEALNVGKILSESNFWLQLPHNRIRGTTYRNPQILWLPDFDSFQAEMNETANLSSASKDKPTRPKTIQQELEPVFRESRRNQTLKEVDGDQRLQTQLYP
jgi:SWI/SNF-related matrix-associated actin-dependent regulator of chromatin subfamily A3